MDDFESQYAEELEMLEHDFQDGGPPSRRALTLASPFLPPGASRKRPMEESPLPPIPSDIDSTPGLPRKAPRLRQSATPTTHNLSSSPPASNEALASSTTPSRKSDDGPSRRGRRSNGQGEATEADVGSASHPYSPPSPYALSFPSSSPPLSPSRTSGARDRAASITVHTQASPQSLSSRSLPSSQRKEGKSVKEQFDHLHSLLRGKPSAIDPPALEDDDEDWSLHTNTGRQSREQDLHSQKRPLSPTRAHRSPSRVLSRAPPGDHMTVTASDGRRVYLRLRPKSTTEATSNTERRSHVQLLTTPFTQLRDSVEEERRRKLIEQSDRLLKSLTSTDFPEEGSQDLFDSVGAGEARGGVGESEGGAGEGGTGGGAGKMLLWVDQYSPKNFTELLSDDEVNRTLLSWLKLWDETVFGQTSFRPKRVKGGGGRGGGGGGGGRGGGGGKGGGVTDSKAAPGGKPGHKFPQRVDYKDPSAFAGPEALDETRRPKMKVALLCGAPGLGKTTLGHVIARHAGYNVIEINASDDRSPEVFHEKIESATQMQSVLTAQSRPNCLIIDEIDGAPTAAINVLIDTIKKKETGKKRKKKSTPLSRPIICICNDPYAPSLRQLRQHALVLSFPPTITSRLAARLHQVARLEHMSASMSTLMALCEKSDTDIRACLNTLQFIQRRQKNLTLAAVQSASIGQKDAHRSLYSLWKETFQIPSAKRHTLNAGPLKLGATTDSVSGDLGGSAAASAGGHNSSKGGHQGVNATRFYDMFLAASSTGEYDKVSQGLFENYLHIKFRDPHLEAISMAQEWTVFHDSLQQHILRGQDYSFMAYLPYLTVAFHFLFAAPSKPQIQYPHTSFEVFQRSQHSSNLLTSLLLEVPPSMRRTLNRRLLMTEMLPLILEIISPTFRPVSTQLYSAREKQQLSDLVDTMISYNLTYRQEKSLEGQYAYTLDPNVEELCRFPGLPQRKQLTYGAKQLIAREVEVEKMRRSEKVEKAREVGKEASSAKKGSTAAPEPTPTQPSQAPPTKAPPTVKRESLKTSTDFFGRAVKGDSNQKFKGSRPFSRSSEMATHPLWFRFNEGYSNAVRRPVRVKDLF